MKALEACVFFQGNCREAMEFYKSVLGGELFIMRVGDMPNNPFPAEKADLILHSRLSSAGWALIGSDEVMPGVPEPRSGFTLSIEAGDEAEMEQQFAGLAEGGEVTMPLQETFWAPKFGMLTDRFGVKWMLNLAREAE